MLTISPMLNRTNCKISFAQNNEEKPLNRPKSINERFEDFKRDGKIGERRPLEHFNGIRKVEAYKGKGYVNKITEKLTTTPKLELIRNMGILPGSKPPVYVDNNTVLMANGGRDIVHFLRMEMGKPEEGFIIKIFRRDQDSLRRIFKTFSDMRQDKEIMGILKEIVGDAMKGFK